MHNATTFSQKSVFFNEIVFVAVRKLAQFCWDSDSTGAGRDQELARERRSFAMGTLLLRHRARRCAILVGVQVNTGYLWTNEFQA
jgi:hypothetical protein